MAKHDPELSRLFHALSDTTRRSTLSRLALAPAPVTALAEPTGLALPTVMRYLAVLEEAGLIQGYRAVLERDIANQPALIISFKDGRTRTCALVPEALEPMRTWIDDQRAVWEARLDRLDAFVMQVMKESER